MPSARSTTCPQCGSRNTVRIALGRPRPDLPRGQRKPKSLLERLGGGIDNPDRVCRKCGYQWKSRTLA